jgi:exosortase
MVTVLVHQWLTDPDYSHGPLVPLFSAYLLWRRRDRFAQCRSAPCTFGYFVIVAGIVLYVLGAAAVVGYLMRVSLIVVLVGLILFFSGRQAFAVAAFPLGYLMFMIPPPYVVSDRITLPLQFLASNLATSALDIVGVPVFREGNIITLAAGQLAVSEACSGIRSLVALGAIATIYAYLAFPDWGRRGLVIMSAVPIAIVTNAARVMVTGLLADALGLERAMGFYHAFSGLVIFALAVVLLLLEGAALSMIVPIANGKRAHAQSI